MTSNPPNEPLLPEYVAPSPLTRLRDGITGMHARRRLVSAVRDVPGRWFGMWEWVVPTALLVIAALTRFIALENPHELVFDETYYVKDAWSLFHLGYEGSWPEGADKKFAAGDTMIFTPEGSRVVHPPLGKWLIALGMLPSNGVSSFGWRFATALLGVLTVLVTYLIARRLTRSVWWGGMAGLFLAIDGLSISMSRVALLDGILTFFVLLGVLFLVLDHRAAAARIATSPDAWAGPVMWRRPWVVAAGAAFGAASAVKWSGFAVLAGFGIALVVSDALARRRAGIRMWGSSAIGRQGPVTFLLFVPVAVVVYVVSWTGWLLTSGGYDRGGKNPLFAFIDYHLGSLSFHVDLTASHPYASPAWQWPFLIRPTAMYWQERGCGDGTCVQTITALPNPFLWWIGVIAALGLILVWFRFRDWRAAIILVGLATTYLPWLLVPQRTIFQFYTVLMMPFMMIAIALVLQRMTRDTDPAHATERRVWQVISGCVVGIAVAVSVFFLPLATGMEISRPYWQLHMWLSSWI